MNKKAWFGLDPRLELLILAILIFLLLLNLGPGLVQSLSFIL